MKGKLPSHLSRVAQLPCIVCLHMGLGFNNQVQVHHLFDTTHRSDLLTAPLCQEHHTGGTGFHGLGAREFERMYRLDELDLLEKTLEMLWQS